MVDSATNLERMVQHTRELYSLPAVAVKVLELTDQPQVDITALRTCIENDPAITTKILRVVNSSLFGMSGKVKDLKQAIALLGIGPLKLLVLGFSLPEKLQSHADADALASYWRRALTKAVAARSLAARGGRIDSDDAFLAGLLSDLGMLVLIKEVGDAYVQFLARSREHNWCLKSLEEEALGYDHVELTVALLTGWSFPTSIVARLEGSRQQLEKSPERESRSLVLAELFTQLAAEHRLAVLPDLIECGANWYGLTRDDIQDLVQEIDEKVDLLADVLSLKLSEGDDYRDVLLEAQRRLAAASEEVLATRQVLVPVASTGGMEPRAGEREHAATVATRELSQAADAIDFSQSAEQIAVATPEPDNGRLASPRETTMVVEDAVPRSQLIAWLTWHLASARKRRTELSLVVISRAKGALSHVERRRLETMIAALGHRPYAPRWISASDLAVLFHNCDRAEAVRIAEDLRNQLQTLPSSPRSAPMLVNIGVGTVPMVPRNLPAEELLAGAMRCLQTARASGAGSIKSIEVC